MDQNIDISSNILNTIFIVNYGDEFLTWELFFKYFFEHISYLPKVNKFHLADVAKHCL